MGPTTYRAMYQSIHTAKHHINAPEYPTTKLPDNIPMECLHHGIFIHI